MRWTVPLLHENVCETVGLFVARQGACDHAVDFISRQRLGHLRDRNQARRSVFATDHGESYLGLGNRGLGHHEQDNADTGGRAED